MNEEDFKQEKRLKKEYDETMLREELFWSQKSREMWLKEGDMNKKVFLQLNKN